MAMEEFSKEFQRVVDRKRENFEHHKKERQEVDKRMLRGMCLFDRLIIARFAKGTRTRFPI